MTFEALPAQVKAVCDGDDCGAALEYDGIELHFDAVTAAEDVRDYLWSVTDGRVLCSECAP